MRLPLRNMEEQREESCLRTTEEKMARTVAKSKTTAELYATAQAREPVVYSQDMTPEEEAAIDADQVAKSAKLKPSAITSKRQAFEEEGVRRIAAIVPDLDDIAAIKALAAMWPPTKPTQDLLDAKDVYVYVRDTVPVKLDALPDHHAVFAIDETATDPFGDGTPWPS